MVRSTAVNTSGSLTCRKRRSAARETATDIMWAIANPNTHYALISERRWTSGQYEQWLAHTLICALLTARGGEPDPAGVSSAG
jgi:hypothetical protein